MARETKVGLLAGLAFIVCFATILTKRGRDGGYRRVFPELVADDPSGHPNSHASEFPSHQPGSIQDRNRAVKSAEFSRVSESPAPVGGPARSKDSSSEGSLNHRQAAGKLHEPVPADVKGKTQPGDGGDSRDQVWRAKLERRLEELAEAVHQKDAAPQPSLPQSQPVALSAARKGDPGHTPNAAPAEYLVQKGDTLTSVAARFYGTRSSRVINAIFDANRERLPHVSQLRAGIALALPFVEGFDRPRIITTNKPQQRSKQKSRAVRTPTRKPTTQKTSPRKSASREKKSRTVWYDVKKNDRYSSIARDELGDAGRWREIFELNKDRFPDPHKIRPGVRIKLPPIVLAVSGGATR